MINEIYNSGKILEDQSRLIFIALPKKKKKTIAGKCEFQTISLSLLTKLMIKIRMNCVWSRIRNKGRYGTWRIP